MSTTETSQAVWEATLLVEGEPTEDGRMLEVGSISWRDLPLSLMAMLETGPGGHEGARLAGRIDSIARSGNRIIGNGIFDGGEFGAEIAGYVADRTLRGVSVDLAILDYEIRNRETGEVIDEEAQIDAWIEGIPTLFVVTDGVIGAATVCPFQAIEAATIEIVAGAPLTAVYNVPIIGTPERFIASTPQHDRGVLAMRLWVPFGLSGLTASAAGEAPVNPPAEWFDNPNLTGPTPLTVTDDGRVFGHLALWDSCHMGQPEGPGICTRPPRSATNYSLFHLGEIVCADGQRVAVGSLTLDTDHARRGLDPRTVRKHYDNTGTTAAHVRAGDDRFGIYVAGAARPDLPVERLRDLRAAKISGDWRKSNGSLELVAALAVNVPGYPVPRPEALVASGANGDEIVALIAAGIYEETPTVLPVETRIQIEAAAALGGIDAVAALALED